MVDGDSTIQNLLIALVCLVSVITICMLSFFFIRRRRLARLSQSTQLLHLGESTKLPSSGSIPEIRIQFAENRPSQDKTKYPENICVVQVGESGAAFVTPLKQNPPSYADSPAFEQLDLERIGGLKDMQDREPLMGNRHH